MPSGRVLPLPLGIYFVGAGAIGTQSHLLAKHGKLCVQVQCIVSSVSRGMFPLFSTSIWCPFTPAKLPAFNSYYGYLRLPSFRVGFIRYQCDSQLLMRVSHPLDCATLPSLKAGAEKAGVRSRMKNKKINIRFSNLVLKADAA